MDQKRNWTRTCAGFYHQLGLLAMMTSETHLPPGKFLLAQGTANLSPAWGCTLLCCSRNCLGLCPLWAAAGTGAGGWTLLLAALIWTRSRDSGWLSCSESKWKIRTDVGGAGGSKQRLSLNLSQLLSYTGSD